MYLASKVDLLEAAEEGKGLNSWRITANAIRKKMKALKLLTHFYRNFLQNHAS